MKPEILAIIPARGGSKGIPGKNLKKLAGKPLIQYTIDAAKKSRFITRVIVSSDDSRILGYCKRRQIEVPFVRPEKLAGDAIPMLPVIQHAVKELFQSTGYVPDYIIILQPTSPLRTFVHIDEALSRLVDSEADSIVSVVEVPHNFNPVSIMRLKGGYLKPYVSYDEKRNTRQLKPKFYARNGAAIYAFTHACLLKKKSIYGTMILPYFMRPNESIDIDSEFDLRLASLLLKNRRDKG